MKNEKEVLLNLKVQLLYAVYNNYIHALIYNEPYMAKIFEEDVKKLTKKKEDL